MLVKPGVTPFPGPGVGAGADVRGNRRGETASAASSAGGAHLLTLFLIYGFTGSPCNLCLRFHVYLMGGCVAVKTFYRKASQPTPLSTLVGLIKLSSSRGFGLDQSLTHNCQPPTVAANCQLPIIGGGGEHEEGVGPAGVSQLPRFGEGRMLAVSHFLLQVCRRSYQIPHTGVVSLS